MPCWAAIVSMWRPSPFHMSELFASTPQSIGCHGIGRLGAPSNVSRNARGPVDGGGGVVSGATVVVVDDTVVVAAAVVVDATVVVVVAGGAVVVVGGTVVVV